MSYKIDTRKLRKALDELIADVEAMPKERQRGGHVRGTGAVIGKVGHFYISIDVDQFMTNDLAIFAEVITDTEGK